jgi:hypothetical protein
LPSRNRNFSNNQLIAAIITGIFTIVAVFIGGARAGPGIGISPQPAATVTITAGPTYSAPSSVRARSSAPGVSTSSLAGKIYLSTLKPVESIYTSVVAGSVQFSATTYQHSIRFTCEGGQSSVVYNVAGLNFLDATIDVPDDANNAAGNTATITFLKNGTTTQLGQPITDVLGQLQPIHVDLQGAAQLDIACTAVAASDSYSSMDIALGNATIGPSP